MAAFSSAAPTRSRNEVHWEKTTARLPEAMSPCRRTRSSFIFVLCAAMSVLPLEEPLPADWPALQSSAPAAAVFSRRRAGKRDAPGSTRRDLRSTPGRRQTGHSPLHCLTILSAHSRQKMCPQGVIVGSSGRSQQIGQSGSSPARSSSRRLLTNFSGTPFSPPVISWRHRRSRDWMSSSAAPSRAKTRNGWHRACRSRSISCRICVYIFRTSPRATNVSNCVFAFPYSAS
mmetsp:Transcript_83526/g.236976  ORF Transcript_83526/g.236976 Transcript_83526/m.236976 type:complete len:230 (-) Transcript_83526:460-1149(-)